MKYSSLFVLLITALAVLTPTSPSGERQLTAASSPAPRTCDSCGKPTRPPGVRFD